MTFDGTGVPSRRWVGRLGGRWAINAVISGANGLPEGGPQLRIGLTDAGQGVLDAALYGASGALGGRAGAPGPPTEAHGPPELGGEEVDSFAGAGRAGGVAERLGLRERVAQIVEAAAVVGARLVVEQLARVATVDRSVLPPAPAPAASSRT